MTGARGLSDLAVKWEEEAQAFERRGQKSVADLLRSCAHDLRVQIQTFLLEEITVEQASEWSGLSVSTIYRQIKEGKIPAVGKNGTTRIRRLDVPVSPEFMAATLEELGEVERED